jgi:hypothetical protein
MDNPQLAELCKMRCVSDSLLVRELYVNEMLTRVKTFRAREFHAHMIIACR